MPLLSEQVDLDEYPSTIREDFTSQATIGDMHANALKLIYFLVKEGVIKLNKDANDYDELSELYFDTCIVAPDNIDAPCEPLTEENLAIFNRILSEATINPAAIKNKEFLIRFLGDLVSDRGANDYFILAILDKLTKAKVRNEKLFANHDAIFIQAMESKDFANFDPKWINNKGQTRSLDRYGQINSLKGLQRMVKDNLITMEEVKRLYHEAYLPNLKLVSYTLSEDKKSISLYTHAPVDIQIIREIARKFRIDYDDTTVEKLAETIDLINLKFYNYGKAGKISTLYDKENTDNIKVTPEKDPIALLMWHRSRRAAYETDRVAKLYQGHKNEYSVTYVHGHDSHPDMTNYLDKRHIVDLNKILGQYTNRQGEYAIFTAKGTTNDLTLSASPSEEKERASPISSINSDSSVIIEDSTDDEDELDSKSTYAKILPALTNSFDDPYSSTIDDAFNNAINLVEADNDVDILQQLTNTIHTLTGFQPNIHDDGYLKELTLIFDDRDVANRCLDLLGIEAKMIENTRVKDNKSMPTWEIKILNADVINLIITPEKLSDITTHLEQAIKESRVENKWNKILEFEIPKTTLEENEVLCNFQESPGTAYNDYPHLRLVLPNMNDKTFSLYRELIQKLSSIKIPYEMTSENENLIIVITKENAKKYAPEIAKIHIAPEADPRVKPKLH